MNILVTGGAGFIGSHLVDALVGQGHSVTALDDLSTGKLSNLGRECELEVGDIRDPCHVANCVKGRDVVFHLAAFASVPGSIENPDLCADVNVNGTRILLESACREGVRRLVFASTSAVYPEYPDIPRSEAGLLDPKSPYAESKLEGERLLERYGENRELSYAALRFFNVYGPRQDAQSDYASVIPRFIHWGQNHAKLTIYGDGSQSRDFVFVLDVVEALLRAMDSHENGVFNVGTSHPVSVMKLAQQMTSLMGSDGGYTFEPPRPGDAMSSTADVALISAKLGWTPQWDLETGLAETIRWFNRQRNGTDS